MIIITISTFKYMYLCFFMPFFKFFYFNRCHTFLYFATVLSLNLKPMLPTFRVDRQKNAVQLHARFKISLCPP